MWPRKSSKKPPAAKAEPAKKPQPIAAPAKPRQPSPPADVYTVFLAIALVAILVAILFLCLEMSPYEFKFNGGPPVVRIDGHGTEQVDLSIADLCRVRETHQAVSLAVRFTHPTMAARFTHPTMAARFTHATMAARFTQPAMILNS